MAKRKEWGRRSISKAEGLKRPIKLGNGINTQKPTKGATEGRSSKQGG